MKKLIFVCMFAMFALFASANKGNFTKVFITKQKTEKDTKPQWAVTETCGNVSYTSCCYGSASQAENAGWAIYFELCS